jgi:uncharacterized NAD(P)/FAD-binding protein YdhS
MLHVAIIGGGASGTLAAMAFARLERPVRITLVEARSRQLNRGVAYSCRLSRQSLNVPAGRMGLRSADAEGFLRWLHAGPLPQAAHGDFVPRSHFGDYLADAFNEVLDAPGGRVDVLRAKAIALEPHLHGGHDVLLVDGRRVYADAVILALGNAPPAHPADPPQEVIGHPGYIAWPWEPGVLDDVRPEDPVLFVGAGLTMVDVLLSLQEQGHRGPVTVLSRSGRLPAPHAAPVPWTIGPDRPREGDDLLVHWRWVRSEVRRAQAEGVPWQSVMDAVKPHVRAWWQHLPMHERSRFLRHARPFWEIHRHRMPPCAARRIQDLLQAGRLRSLAARVVSIAAIDQEHLAVTYRNRGGTDHRTEHFARVINCTGPQTALRLLDQPLLRDMLAKGLAAPDDLRLGLRCRPDGSVLDRDGRVTEGVFALGPMCKAALWECTAIPEIRDQAEGLAMQVATHMEAPEPFWGRVLRAFDLVALRDP